MNIELGIGIGSGTLASPTSNDRLVAFAWAMAGTHNVITSTVIHKSVTSVPATGNVSAIVPSISNADNVTVLAVQVTANANALIPSVAIAGSISVNAVIASSNLDSVIPVVSTIRNASVGGVVVNSTASAGIPAVSVGGGATTYYLQMDGVDDYLKTPTITFDEFIIDFTMQTKIPQHFIIDARIGSTAYSGYGTGSGARGNPSIGSFDSGYLDGVLQATPWYANKNLVDGIRTVLRLTSTTTKTDDVNLLSSNTATDFTPANVYDIKFYNGATLVAHYNMSTGTVQDQSGNGNHATLTGGTWVVA